MPTVEVPAELTIETLLKAAEQLSGEQLHRLAQQIVTLRGRRLGHSLSHEETALLLEINRGVPVEVQSRFNELIGQRNSQSLTNEEHEELLRLTDEIECFEARRAERLAELARCRGISLNQLMGQLQISPQSHAE